MEPTPVDDLLLPEGTRLVHIGPPKTGTTSVQGAFHARRAEVLAQGVRYAGATRHSAPAILAVTGRPSPQRQGEPPRMDKWNALRREIERAREPRIVLSSEFLADADPEAIRRVVEDLDLARVHVVVTLRPLARILPSQWQQYVQSGMSASYETFLDAMFNKPPGALAPSFWRRHRHDELVARWADVVGRDRLTVIALDEADRDMVLRAFERLVGLTEGTLVGEEELENRSMTWPEVEVVRAFNRAFRQEGLGTPLHTKVMRYGAAIYMKQRRPADDERRIDTPQWAIDRAAEVEREMVERLGSAGVRVVGDLEKLTASRRSGLAADTMPPPEIAPPVAARAMMGILVASGLARGDDGLNGSSMPWTAEPIELARLSSGQLLSVLAHRGRGEVVRRLRRPIRRGR